MKPFDYFEQSKSWLNESEDISLASNPIVKKFLEKVSISKGEIPLEEISVQKTPKGNWVVLHKGKDLLTLDSKLLNDDLAYEINRQSKYSENSFDSFRKLIERKGSVRYIDDLTSFPTKIQEAIEAITKETKMEAYEILNNFVKPMITRGVKLEEITADKIKGEINEKV